MDQVDRITLNSLVQLGLDLTCDDSETGASEDDASSTITSIAQLSSNHLFQAVALCLNAIHAAATPSNEESVGVAQPPFPVGASAVPSSISARFKLAQSLAAAASTQLLRNSAAARQQQQQQQKRGGGAGGGVGNTQPVSAPNLLYPNEADSRALLMRLLEAIPISKMTSSGGGNNQSGDGDDDDDDVTSTAESSMKKRAVCGVTSYATVSRIIRDAMQSRDWLPLACSSPQHTQPHTMMTSHDQQVCAPHFHLFDEAEIASSATASWWLTWKKSCATSKWPSQSPGQSWSALRSNEQKVCALERRAEERRRAADDAIRADVQSAKPTNNCIIRLPEKSKKLLRIALKQQRGAFGGGNRASLPTKPPKPIAASKKPSTVEKKENEKDGNSKNEKEEEDALELQLENCRAALHTAESRFEELCSRVDSERDTHNTHTHELAALRNSVLEQSERLTSLTRIAQLMPEFGVNRARMAEAVESRRALIGQLQSEAENRRTTRLRNAEAGEAATCELEEAVRRTRAELAQCRAKCAEKERAELEFQRRLEQQQQQQQKAKSGESGGDDVISRMEFTRRLTELSENNRKQQAEIRKLLSELFQLQRELSFLRGRLDRTFTAADDLLYRRASEAAAEKGGGGGGGSSESEAAGLRNLYAVLGRIHAGCVQLAELVSERAALIRYTRTLEQDIETQQALEREKRLERVELDLAEVRDLEAALRRRVAECVKGRTTA